WTVACAGEQGNCTGNSRSAEGQGAAEIADLIGDEKATVANVRRGHREAVIVGKSYRGTGKGQAGRQRGLIETDFVERVAGIVGALINGYVAFGEDRIAIAQGDVSADDNMKVVATSDRYRIPGSAAIGADAEAEEERTALA